MKFVALQVSILDKPFPAVDCHPPRVIVPCPQSGKLPVATRAPPPSARAGVRRAARGAYAVAVRTLRVYVRLGAVTRPATRDRRMTDAA